MVFGAAQRLAYLAQVIDVQIDQMAERGRVATHELGELLPVVDVTRGLDRSGFGVGFAQLGLWRVLALVPKLNSPNYLHTTALIMQKNDEKSIA